MKKILVLNGPNLNMLGKREPEIYGTMTLWELEQYIYEQANELDIVADCIQSNHEGEIIDEIQYALEKHDGIIINAGGYTHTSVAIMDALKAVGLPVVEVHLSDIKKREEFRHHSYISLVAKKIIFGKGKEGYREALEFFVDSK